MDLNKILEEIKEYEYKQLIDLYLKIQSEDNVLYMAIKEKRLIPIKSFLLAVNLELIIELYNSGDDLDELLNEIKFHSDKN